MTSPRVCLLPESCQATLPALSQPPPPPTRLDNKLQPATAGVSQLPTWVPGQTQAGDWLPLWNQILANRGSFTAVLDSWTVGVGTLRR